MANIVLCRIDSRLIHGQVVTKWVGQSQANRIAVVSDELDADPFMKNIYLMAAPPNIKVDCYSNQSFAASWQEGAIGVFTAGKLTRTSVYHQAVILALSPFHNAVYQPLQA